MHLSAHAPQTRNAPLLESLTGWQSRALTDGASPDSDAGAAGIRHDLGNLVTALRLCADLIAEDGVLAPSHIHLAQQLSAVVAAAERLTSGSSTATHWSTASRVTDEREQRVGNLGQAVRELGPLMAAIAGPRVDVQIACMPCPGELSLTDAGLTRVLMNLVRNSADAMPTGGKIRITVQRNSSGVTRRRSVLLTVADNGPGIAPGLLERIFEPGLSTRHSDQSGPEPSHRGLGLSLVQQILAKAGGTISAQNGAAGGARFLIELPLTNVTPCTAREPLSLGVTEA